MVPRPELWGIFPGSSWRRMKLPIEVTRLTARRWERVPDPVPGFLARDTDSDGRAGPLIVFTARPGGGCLLGGLVPRDEGAGVTEVLGLEDGFSARGRRWKGRGSGQEEEEGGWGKQGQEWRGFGPPRAPTPVSQWRALPNWPAWPSRLRSVSVPPRSRTGARGGAGGDCGGGR